MSTPVIRISEVADHVGQTVRLQGWLYNKRGSGKVQFVHLRDGSGFMQCVMGKQDVSEAIFEKTKGLTQETSIIVTGEVKAEERAPYCGHELICHDVEIVSEAKDYPITKKAHGDAFLMDHRHLWLRSRRQHVILRVRATIVKAIRDYLDDNGFLLVDSPIFTPNACEGTSTLFSTPWFDESEAYLSQSGQLYQEATALAFGKTYCFGPTFRAEKSKTRRHLNEFWMVEPEAAYMTLEQDMDLMEDFLCHIVQTVLDKHEPELVEVLERDLTVLKKVKAPFPRIHYDDAVKEILAIRDETDDPEQKELLNIEWGMDFGSPHETELTKRYDTPIMVYGFPSQVKAFYMKKDPDRPEVSRSVDVLAPEGYGEIIGGGEREDSLEVLEKAIKDHELPEESFRWYVDLRRYGSVPHAGFGLGVERTVAWLCGLHHVRETIPFARTLDRIWP
jgi:asparaginyl-tRNA synthetase